MGCLGYHQSTSSLILHHVMTGDGNERERDEPVPSFPFGCKPILANCSRIVKTETWIAQSRPRPDFKRIKEETLMNRINSIRTYWRLHNPIDLLSLVPWPQRSFTLVSVKSQKRSYSLDSPPPSYPVCMFVYLRMTI